jgi:hypothetical protein
MSSFVDFDQSAAAAATWESHSLVVLLTTVRVNELVVRAQ